MRACCHENIHIHIGIYLFAASLTVNEIYQISESQERASSKRFSNVCPPTRIALDRASAVRSAVQNYNIFASYQKLIKKYIISPLFSRGEKSFQISVFSRRIVSRSCRGAWEGARDAWAVLPAGNHQSSFEMIPVENINTWLVFRGLCSTATLSPDFSLTGKELSVFRFQFSEGRLEGKVILNSKPPSGRFFTMMVPW